MSHSSPIENIADTAFGVAFCRAIETERPDAHFQDPFARLLAGERGEQVVQALRGGPSVGWGMVVRTCIIDELVLRSIEQQGVDTVLNLAAGLDTRPYRLPIPSWLHWIDVDLPAIMSYKQQKLAHVQPQCTLELVSMDLTDLAARGVLFSQVNAEAKQVLVLTEGLLVYLSSRQVSSLAKALHAQTNFHWWLSDLVSPFVLKTMHKEWNKLTGGAFTPQFAPTHPTQFFQQFGWKTSEFRSLWQEAYHLNRQMRFGSLLRLLPALKDGLVLFEQV